MRQGGSSWSLLLIIAAGVIVTGQARPPVQAPYFEVDPYWPKPLPNHFVMGSVVGSAQCTGVRNCGISGASGL